MKKGYLRAAAGILACTFILQSPADNTVFALSKANEAAHKAFKTTLKNSKKQFFEGTKEKLRYAYADVDGDKIDELIISPGFGYYGEGVFDYKSGKVKEAAVVGQGTFTIFYPTNKVISVKNSGHMGILNDYYYKQNSKTGVYKVVAHIEKVYADDDIEYKKAPVKTTYYKNDKKVSKATFVSYAKSLKKDSTVLTRKKLKWHKY